jgi:hypothetical protein
MINITQPLSVEEIAKLVALHEEMHAKQETSTSFDEDTENDDMEDNCLCEQCQPFDDEEEFVEYITIHDLAQWDPTMVGRMLADEVDIGNGLHVRIVDCSSIVQFNCYIEGEFVGMIDADGFADEKLAQSPLYDKILEDLRKIFPMICE